MGDVLGKLNQPHDKYFRATFEEVGFAKDFLSNYLPEELVDIFTEAIILFTKNRDKDMVKVYVMESITYILGVRDDITVKELVEIAAKISTEGGDLVMTAADRLRQEGKKEGEIMQVQASSVASDIARVPGSAPR